MQRVKILLPLMLLVFLIGLPRAAAVSTTRSYSIDGSYQITVKPEHYRDYTTMVTIKKIDDRTIKISGTYDGIPIMARGVLRGQHLSPGMDTYDVKINNGLFSGKVVLNFCPQEKGCQISGFGSGRYDYLGWSGSATATIAGVSSKVGFNVSTVLLVLLMVGAVVTILWLSQRRQPTRK